MREFWMFFEHERRNFGEDVIINAITSLDAVLFSYNL